MTSPRPRLLLLGGLLFAVLSLGLPWGAYTLPGYYTVGTYVSGYCDSYYCYDGYYQPGYFIPGTADLVSGAESSARFFVVTAIALAVAGWRLNERRLLRAAVVVAGAGIALHLPSGLTGGSVALAVAAACLWVASRRLGPEDVMRTEDPAPRSA